MSIHPSALIDQGAHLGTNVNVGANVIIGSNVIIGNNVTIQNNCEIGVYAAGDNNNPLIIGDNSFIRSQSIFYCGSVFDEGLVTGHRVTVREGVNAGKNLQLGTLTDLQGDCIIGDYVRLHSNVHVGKHSKIGNFV